MAFLDVGNGKKFILDFVENQKVKKAVSPDEFSSLYRLEKRRKEDWDEWNDFQLNCKKRFGKEPVNEEFKVMNEKYRMNVEVNDLDSISMNDEFSRRTRYVRRLEYIPHLLSDQEYEMMGSEMDNVYQSLLNRIQNDALEEVKEKIISNNIILDFNSRYNVSDSNKYYLTDKQRRNTEMEVTELQNLKLIIESGEFSMRHDKSDIFALCHESAISSFKSVYVATYEKQDEDTKDTNIGERKI